jgi:hypothetical protein
MERTASIRNDHTIRPNTLEHQHAEGLNEIASGNPEAHRRITWIVQQRSLVRVNVPAGYLLRGEARTPVLARRRSDWKAICV